MTKLEQIDKKIECGEEDRQELKKELRHNESENLDNYFVLATRTQGTQTRVIEEVVNSERHSRNRRSSKTIQMVA